MVWTWLSKKSLKLLTTSLMESILGICEIFPRPSRPYMVLNITLLSQPHSSILLQKCLDFAVISICETVLLCSLNFVWSNRSFVFRHFLFLHLLSRPASLISSPFQGTVGRTLTVFIRVGACLSRIIGRFLLYCSVRSSALTAGCKTGGDDRISWFILFLQMFLSFL